MICDDLKGMVTITVLPSLNVIVAFRGSPFGQRSMTAWADLVTAPLTQFAVVTTCERPNRLSVPPFRRCRCTSIRREAGRKTYRRSAMIRCPRLRP